MDKNLRAYLYTAITTILAFSNLSVTYASSILVNDAGYSNSIQICYEVGLIKLDTSK